MAGFRCSLGIRSFPLGGSRELAEAVTLAMLEKPRSAGGCFHSRLTPLAVIANR